MTPSSLDNSTNEQGNPFVTTGPVADSPGHTRKPSLMRERVTVIVLNWNGKANTLACLESLHTQTVPVDVVVVDNGSQDDSVAAIAQRWPDATLLATGRNLGYTGGNNVGIRHGLANGAPYLFVLNNDTRLAPDCVAALLEACATTPGAVAAAPKSLSTARPETIHFAGGRITNSGSAHHIGLDQPDGPAYGVAGDTDWITGCALFVSREGFEKVGLFDERYFLLFEDLDWSLRARRLGCRLRYAPAARLWHRGSESFGGKRGPNYHYYFTRNGLLWLECHYRAAKRASLGMRFLHRAWQRAQRLGETALERRTLQKATLLGVQDYLGRRFGQGNLSAVEAQTKQP